MTAKRCDHVPLVFLKETHDGEIVYRKGQHCKRDATRKIGIWNVCDVHYKIINANGDGGSGGKYHKWTVHNLNQRLREQGIDPTPFENQE